MATKVNNSEQLGPVGSIATSFTKMIGCQLPIIGEAEVDEACKNAIVKSSPKDFVLTSRISGTPVAIFNTKYVKNLSKYLPLPVQWLKNNRTTKKFMVPLMHFIGMKGLEDSVKAESRKQVWSAGQTVGLIDEVLSCREIMELFYKENIEKIRSLPTTSSLTNGPL